MKIDPEDFRVPPGKKVDLHKWPTIVKPFFSSKSDYQKILTEHVEKLSELQRMHYASDRYALLLIFQARFLDAGGAIGRSATLNRAAVWRPLSNLGVELRDVAIWRADAARSPLLRPLIEIVGEVRTEHQRSARATHRRPRKSLLASSSEIR